MLKRKPLRTQKDLMAFMRANNACFEARTYVDQFESRTPAKKIWVGCRHPEWLLWLGTRRNPEVALRYCQQTIKRVANELNKKGPSEDQQHYITLAARDCVTAGKYLLNSELALFCMSTHWAFYESHRAAPSYTAEADIRLEELRKMW
jgi:hypothetical protein